MIAPSCLSLHCAQTTQSPRRRPDLSRFTSSQLHLVPISRYNEDITFLSESEEFRCCIDEEGRFHDGGDVYELCLVEETDVPDLSRFVIASFGADAIRLSQDMSAIERMIMSPAATLLNSYSGLVAFAEVLSGIKQRVSDRLKRMDILAPELQGLTRNEKIDVAASNSLILALGKRTEGSDWKVDIIASIELRLQPCDAKIPFSLPWLDRIERNLASLVGLGEGTSRDLQPYLSNLCVDEKYRGRRIGRALVRCVENISMKTWNYHRIYLHVDQENPAAMSLYKSEGYRDVGHRWNPFWAGSAADIAYFVKTLESTTHNTINPSRNDRGLN
jgi:ribosomal protein S18 acetylase RimI-like enzyme